MVVTKPQQTGTMALVLVPRLLEAHVSVSAVFLFIIFLNVKTHGWQGERESCSADRTEIQNRSAKQFGSILSLNKFNPLSLNFVKNKCVCVYIYIYLYICRYRSIDI